MGTTYSSSHTLVLTFGCALPSMVLHKPTLTSIQTEFKKLKAAVVTHLAIRVHTAYDHPFYRRLRRLKRAITHSTTTPCQELMETFTL